MTRFWPEEARRRAPWRGSALRWLTIALAVAAMTAAGQSSSPIALAQASCEVPKAAAARGELGAAKSGEQAAAPAAVAIQDEGEEAATPAALPAASPVTASPVATVDPAVLLADELSAVSEALAACLTAGDEETVTKLAGERYLGQLFGSSVPLPAEEYLAIAIDLTPTPTRVLSVEEVSGGEERATAMVTQVVGNQVILAEWTFTHAPQADRQRDEIIWRLAGERQMPVSPPAGATTIDVTIDNRSFTLKRSSVEGPDVVLSGTNDSNDDHEMLVLRLAPGYSTADLLRAAGPDLPQEVTYIGELPVPSGGSGNLVLVDLEPGTYTLVCLFPDAQGTPHLAQGMEAAFTVT